MGFKVQQKAATEIRQVAGFSLQIWDLKSKSSWKRILKDLSFSLQIWDLKSAKENKRRHDFELVLAFKYGI